VSSKIAGFTLEASFSEIGFLGLTSDFWDVSQELVGVKISVCIWSFLLWFCLDHVSSDGYHGGVKNSSVTWTYNCLVIQSVSWVAC
jgi:hypothetical protein